MKIEIQNVFREIQHYLDRVQAGQAPEICWEEEVIAPYWAKLCAYAPFDLSERKPRPITDLSTLRQQCVLLQRLDMEGLQRTFEKIASALPCEDDDPVTVVIFPGDNSNQTVNNQQNGVIGTSLFGNMLIQVNPLVAEYEPWISYVFAHELHHAVWGNYWFVLHAGELENRLIDALVIEGEADCFALEMHPDLQPKWLFGLPKEEMLALWQNKYKQRLLQKEPDAALYLFGNEKAGIPWCAGYAIGYWLVQRYLRQTNQSVVSILKIKPEDMLQQLLQAET